ncbi:hypothetical protein B0H13DRAFT_1883040 [Mycena leptocephala]|nr:hypothetical protein B0H13DRAFT_1883040 [Mycena leptocephala]
MACSLRRSVGWGEDLGDLGDAYYAVAEVQNLIFKYAVLELSLSAEAIPVEMNRTKKAGFGRSNFEQHLESNPVSTNFNPNLPTPTPHPRVVKAARMRGMPRSIPAGDRIRGEDVQFDVVAEPAVSESADTRNLHHDSTTSADKLQPAEAICMAEVSRDYGGQKNFSPPHSYYIVGIWIVNLGFETQLRTRNFSSAIAVYTHSSHYHPPAHALASPSRSRPPSPPTTRRHCARYEARLHIRHTSSPPVRTFYLRMTSRSRPFLVSHTSLASEPTQFWVRAPALTSMLGVPAVVQVSRPPPIHARPSRTSPASPSTPLLASTLDAYIPDYRGRGTRRVSANFSARARPSRPSRRRPIPFPLNADAQYHRHVQPPRHAFLRPCLIAVSAPAARGRFDLHCRTRTPSALPAAHGTWRRLYYQVNSREIIEKLQASISAFQGSARIGLQDPENPGYIEFFATFPGPEYVEDDIEPDTKYLSIPTNETLRLTVANIEVQILLKIHIQY